MKIIISETQFKNLLVETKDCSTFQTKLPACIRKFKVEYDKNYKVCYVPVKITKSIFGSQILVSSSSNDADIKFIDNNKYQIKDKSGKWLSPTEPFSCNPLFWTDVGEKFDIGFKSDGALKTFGIGEVPLLSIELSNSERTKNKSFRNFADLLNSTNNQSTTNPFSNYFNKGDVQLPKDLWNDYDPNSKFHEPNSEKYSKKSGKNALKGTFVPPQTTNYFNEYPTNRWTRKTIENRGRWRDTPDGFNQLGWQTYQNELKNLLRKDFPSELEKKKTITLLKNSFYTENFPLGLSPEEKAKRGDDIKTAKQITKLKQSELPRDSKSIADKSDTFFDYAKQKEMQGEVIYKKEEQEILNSIDAYYGYFAKPEPSGTSGGFLDWRNLVGFALHIIPLTAPYAYIYDIGLGLYKASQSLEKGNPGEAAAHVLFSFLPQTPIGKELQKVNALRAIDKVLKQKALSAAEEKGLEYLSKNSSYLQSKLKELLDGQLKKTFNRQMTQKQSELLSNAIKKSYSQTQKVASFYEEIKNSSTKSKI